MQQIKKYKINIVFISYLFTLVITLNKSIQIVNFKTMLDIFKTDTLTASTIFILSFILFKNFEFEKLNKRENYIISIFSLIFSIIYIVGTDVTYNHGLFRNKTNKYAIVTFFLLVIISYIVFKYILKIGYKYLKDINFSETNYVENKINKNYFFKLFLPIFIIRLIFFIIYFPGNFTWDSMAMIKEGVGVTPISNSHPYLYVYIMGLFAKFGMNVLQSVGKGVGIFNFLVVTFTSISYTFILCKLFTFDFNKKLKILLYIYFTLNPFFIFYSFTLYKDIPLLNFLLFFVYMIIYMSYKPKQFFKNSMNLVYFSIIVFGVFMLHRKAVIYLIAGFLGILIINKTYRIKTLKYIVFSLIICIFLNQVLKVIIKPLDSIMPYDYLAPRFQQVATTYINHKDSFTKSEIEFIEKLFGVENLKNFNIYEVDPVKNTMNNNFLKHNKGTFYKIWIKGYKKHPKTNIDALLNLSVSYWYPYDSPDIAYKGDYYENMYSSKLNWLTGTDDTNFDNGWKQNTNITNKLKYKYNLHTIIFSYFSNYPLISINHRPGMFTWIFLFLIMISIIRKNKKNIPLIFIVISIILSCIYSPVVNYYRYSYLFVVLIPLLIPLIFIKKEIEK